MTPTRSARKVRENLELTQQVRMGLCSGGRISRYLAYIKVSIPLFDWRNHSSVPTWVPQNLASTGG